MATSAASGDRTYASRAPDSAFCLVDLNGHIRYASPALEQLIGPKRFGDPDRWAQNLAHRDDLPMLQDVWTRLVSEPGLQVSVDFRAPPGHEGGWRVVEFVGTSLLDIPGVNAVVVHLRDVSEQRAADELLRENEASLRAIVDHTTDLLVMVDEFAHIRWVSSAAHDALGYDVPNVIGRNVLDFVHPDDLTTAVPALMRTVNGVNDDLPISVRVRRRDGEWRHMEAMAKVIAGQAHARGAMFSLRDVTERVEAEEAARRESVRFHTVVNHSYDVVAVVDADIKVKWVTPNCQRLLGWSPDEVEGVVGTDFLHPDDIEPLETAFSEFTSGGRPANPTTIRMRHKDGGWRHVEIVATDFLDNPDVQGIAISLRGVDDRTAAELDRKRLTEIFELSSDIVATCTTEGDVVYMNTAGRRFLGVPPEGPVGRLPLDALMSPSELERIMAEFPPHLAGGTPWSGEIQITARDGRVLPVAIQAVGHRDADGNLEYVSAMARDISERKAFERRLEHAATHDPLTGLPNRTLLLQQLHAALARSRRHDRAVGVLFCDLDNFKVVNDSMGHSQGDRLLAAIADRLQAQLRPEDTVGRFGGDEFVVLCEDIDGPEGAVSIAKRVDHAFAQAFRLDGQDVFVGVSTGIAVSIDGHDEPETMIRDADAAMYGAKLRGRARYQLFEAGMWEMAVGRFDLENALRGALGRGELSLDFQPIYRLDQPAPVSVEALLRWDHPERGRLLPDEFIPVAEETGLVVPIGNWVLEEACRRLRVWSETAPKLAGLTMAVNISGRQLDHPEFVDRVADALTSAEVPAERLHLEVTESVLMRDVEQSHDVLVKLRELGVGLAVDDFGTGYSSLSYLRRFPVNSLKVDRTFVDGLGVEAEDSAIVAAVVNLAHTLGLIAVAEGVETAEQRAELERLGCDQVQGRLLNPPMHADELVASLSAKP